MLEVKRRNDHNQGFLVDDNCMGDCTPANRHRKQNSAVRIAYINGFPAAGLCAACGRRWEAMYREFGGSVA